jgi:hypothetical protein
LFAGFLEYPLSRHCCFAISCSAVSIYIVYTQYLLARDITDVFFNEFREISVY